MDELKKTFIISCFLLSIIGITFPQLLPDDYITFESRSSNFEATSMTLDTDVIHFKVIAEKNAMIKLNTPREQDDHILITLGMNKNKQSSIERTNGACFTFDTPDILNENAERPFWITLDKKHVSFGFGEDAGKIENMIGSIPASEAQEITIISFGTEGGTGRWALKKYIDRIYEVKIPQNATTSVVDLSVYQNQFSFQIRSCSAALILLKETPYSADDDSFFVIIGDSYNNTQAAIYHGSMPDNKAVVEIEDILDCFDYRPFWIEWEPTESGLNITLGTGEFPEQTILNFAYIGNQSAVNDISIIGSPSNVTDWIFNDDSAMLSTFYTQPEFDMNQVIRRVAGVSEFIFEVNASAEVHILLFEYYDSDEYYDIVIGGDCNNSTSIYRNRSTEPVLTEHTPDILSDGFHKFWVSWRGGIVEIGRGSMVGFSPILLYEDPDPMNITFLALSTGKGNDGYWRVRTLQDGIIIITTTPDTSPDAVNIQLLPNLQYYGFGVRGCDLARVILMDQEGASSILYQIDIGVENNTMTRIIDSNGTTVVETMTPNILNCARIELFYLRWENGLLQLLNGDEQGMLVIEHTAGPTASDISGITFSSECHKPVDWIVSQLEEQAFEFNTSKVLQTNDYDTVWLDVNERSLIIFSVKACSNAKIVLTTVPGQLDDQMAYEIVIGTGIGRNEIRQGIDGKAVAFDEKNPRLLDCHEYKTFAIYRRQPTEISIAMVTGSMEYHTILTYSEETLSDLGAMTMATDDTAGASWLLRGYIPVHQYSMKTPIYSDYDKAMIIPESNQFTFTVKACEDAQVLLQQNPFKLNASQAAVEVIIGASNNTESLITNYTNGKILASFNHTPLSCHNNQEFWISLDDSDYLIGYGPYIGQQTFLSYQTSSNSSFMSASFKSTSNETAEWSLPLTTGKLAWLGHEISRQNSRTYHWVDILNHGHLVFRIKACEDASIVLAARKDSFASLASEIQIGTSGNNQTVLITNIELGEVPIITEETPFILDCNSFKTFWAMWNSTSLMFGGGGIIHEEVIINYAPGYTFQSNSVIGFGSSQNSEVIYELADIGGPTMSMLIPPMSDVHPPERMTWTTNSDSLVFQIKSCSRAVIRLKTEMDSSAVFEIVFDDNFVTKIIKSPDSADAEEVASVDTYLLLDCNSYRNLWISWTSTMIRLGIGSDPEMFEILSYTDKESIRKSVLSVGTYSPNPQGFKLHIDAGEQYRFRTSDDYSISPHLSILAFTSVVFNVMACNEAVLALSAAPGITDEETYEVVLGYRVNSQAAIRSRSSLTYYKLVEIADLLSCHELRPFWMQWDGCKVSVGKGHVVGDEEFMAFPFDDCHFTSLSLAAKEGIWDVGFREIPMPTPAPTSSTSSTSSTISASAQPTYPSTRTSTASSAPPSAVPIGDDGLNGGEIAGIIIGVILLIIILAIIGWMYRNHSKQKYLNGGNIARYNTNHHDEVALEHGVSHSYNQPNDGSLNFAGIFQEPTSQLDDQDENIEEMIRSFPQFMEKVEEAVEDDSRA